MTYYTHSGMFHCDEVAGFTILKFTGVVNDFVRLKDTSLDNIPKDGVIADIGKVYDPDKLLFDHHQGMIFREDGYPYATAGLLWKYFGFDFVSTFLMNKGITKLESFVRAVVDRVDETLFKGIDASDADSQYNVSSTCRGGDIRVLTLPFIISGMNHDDPTDEEKQNSSFEFAYEFFLKILGDSVKSAIKFIESVEKFESISSFDLGGKLVILEEGLPWREIVHNDYSNAEFVIMPSNRPETSHTMFAVSVEPQSRELKNPIDRPEWFGGFIHVGKWIAAGSLEQLREIAEFNINK